MKQLVSINNVLVHGDLRDHFVVLNHPDMIDKKIIKIYDCLGTELEIINDKNDDTYGVILPVVFGDIDTSFYIEYQER